MIGNTVIAAAVPVNTPLPPDAMQAAPCSAMEAVCTLARLPFLIRSAIVSATVRPITPDGMPVRGGAGVIEVPFGVVRGWDIGCGGAKAMPAAQTLSYLIDW